MSIKLYIGSRYVNFKLYPLRPYDIFIATVRSSDSLFSTGKFFFPVIFVNPFLTTNIRVLFRLLGPQALIPNSESQCTVKFGQDKCVFQSHSYYESFYIFPIGGDIISISGSIIEARHCQDVQCHPSFKQLSAKRDLF